MAPKATGEAVLLSKEQDAHITRQKKHRQTEEQLEDQGLVFAPRLPVPLDRRDGEEEEGWSEREKRGQEPDHVVVTRGSAPASRIHMQVMTMTVRTLYQSRERFFIPPIQRPDSSTAVDESLLLFSALRGVPMPPIYVVRDTDEHNRMRYLVIDGGHRIRDFIKIYLGKVKSPTEKILTRNMPDEGMPPCEPGACMPPLADAVTGRRAQVPERSRVWYLTPDSQDIVEEYPLTIIIFDSLPPEWFAPLWSLLNRDHPMYTGNKLNASMSHTAEKARLLRRWDSTPFWFRVYQRTKHIQDDIKGMRFTVMLTFFALEVAQAPYVITLDKIYLSQWSSGKYNALITDKMLASVHARMGRLANVFAGLEASSWSVSIAMMLASRILEDQEGYDFSKSQPVRKTLPGGAIVEQGCLVDWLRDLQTARKWGANRDGHEGAAYNLISKLIHERDQRKYINGPLAQLAQPEVAARYCLVKKYTGTGE